MGTLRSWILILLIPLFALHSQEWLPISAESRVTDPFETHLRELRMASVDSVKRVEVAFNWQNLYQIEALQNLGMSGTAKLSNQFSMMADFQYLGWGPFVKWQLQAGGIFNLSELKNAFGLNLRTRSLTVSGVYSNTDFQVDLYGLFYPFEDLHLNWTVQNAFEWNTQGPVQGKMALGIWYRYNEYLNLGLGGEKNYLFPSDTWAGLYGEVFNMLGYGISYLSLEGELSFYTSVKVSGFNFIIGLSHHPLLGETYRSSVVWGY